MTNVVVNPNSETPDGSSPQPESQPAQQPVQQPSVQPPADNQQPDKKKPFGKRTGLIALVVVAVVSLATAGYLFYQNQALQANPSEAVSKRNVADTKRILDKLVKVINIDEKEKPTVARVTKPELLQKNNKTFYKDVKANDYLILYPKRAIIYRESTNQIVNVAPIINASQLKAKASPTPAAATPKPKN